MIMPKLMIFDLDGTLLNSKKVISDRTRNAIIRCKNNGVLIGYITSRSTRKVSSFLDGLPCDAISYYNGASVYVGNKLLVSNDISYEDSCNLINTIKAEYPEIEAEICMEPISYKKGAAMNLDTKELTPCSFDELPHLPIQRIRIAPPNELSPDYFKSINTSKLNVFFASDGSVFITDSSAKKEYAMKSIADKLGIELKDTAAFGDDIADLEMLIQAGIGVAMGNSIQLLKNTADYVTDTNDNDGVAVWIENNML